jgi:hypothetical protein
MDDYDFLKAQKDAIVAKQQNINLPSRERAWIEERADLTNTSPNAVATAAVRIYQLWLLGHLVESEDYKNLRSKKP